jgi:hypothetical protein
MDPRTLPQADSPLPTAPVHRLLPRAKFEESLEGTYYGNKLGQFSTI